jgi:hypothetical protein
VTGTSSTTQNQPRGGAFRDRAPQVAVIGIAFTGSFNNILALCHEHGANGLEAWATAGVVDLMAMIAADERQRDKAIGRPRKGWVSFPTLVLIGTIGLSLSMNLATAHQGPWGHIISVISLVAMLMIVFLMERRAAFAARAAAAAGTETAAVPGTEPGEYPVPSTQLAPGTGPAAGTRYPVPGGAGTGTQVPAPPADTGPVRSALSPGAAPPPARPAVPPASEVPTPPPPPRPRLHSADHLPGEVARLMRAHKEKHGRWMKAQDLRAALGINYPLTLQLRREFLAQEEAA